MKNVSIWTILKYPIGFAAFFAAAHFIYEFSKKPNSYETHINCAAYFLTLRNYSLAESEIELAATFLSSPSTTNGKKQRASYDAKEKALYLLSQEDTNDVINHYKQYCIHE